MEEFSRNIIVCYVKVNYGLLKPNLNPNFKSRTCESMVGNVYFSEGCLKWVFVFNYNSMARFVML